jgi:hypothetical protein
VKASSNSVTYHAKITTSSDKVGDSSVACVSALTAGNQNFDVGKTYTWSAGSAEIHSHVDNASYNSSPYGDVYTLSSAASDVYQTSISTLATVNYITSRAKHITGNGSGDAEGEAKYDNKDLDAALKKHLEKYWSEYGN